MSLEKTLKNFGRCVLGTILATNLFFSCDTGTTTTKKEEEPEEPEVIYGEVAGKVVAPKIEDNQLVWFERDNAIIKLNETFKETSSADGKFHFYNIPAGDKELTARYYFNGNSFGTITHISEPLTVPVLEGMLTTIKVEIKLNPYISSEHILHGVVYNKDKATRYNGTVNVNYARTSGGETFPGDVEYSTFVSNGLYAFKGSTDGKFLTTEDGTIIKLLPTENSQNEHSRINLDYDGITEQNGYVSE
jgi:hypothetical protein